jgi:hypothetical protein
MDGWMSLLGDLGAAWVKVKSQAWHDQEEAADIEWNFDSSRCRKMAGEDN